MPHGLRHRHAHQQRIHPVGVPCVRQQGQRVGARPDRIGVHGKHRPVAQKRQRIAQPAAGFQNIGLFHNRLHVAPCQMVQQRVGLIVQVHDDPPQHDTARQIKRVVDQRLARDRDHRLGLVLGQMLHPRAEAGGKHHHGIWGVAHLAFKSFRNSGVGAGREGRSTSAKGASAGSSRLRCT